MRILAIDPGPTESAVLRYDSETRDVEPFGMMPNLTLAAALPVWRDPPKADCLAIEWVSCYGMAVGKDVFDTCRWVGQFEGAWGHNPDAALVFRREVKLYLCNSVKGKDSNVRQALIDKFGGDKVAIGGKKCPQCKGKGWCGRGRPKCHECAGTGWRIPPGPLAKIATHLWAALGVAVTFAERKQDAANN